MSNTAYERVTERVLELLDQGVCPWRQPWSTKSEPPQNYVSGRPYTGMNFFMLSCTGYPSPYFMTFRQVQEAGGVVKKGSEGFPVVYWGTVIANEKDAETPGARPTANVRKEEAGEKLIPFLKTYTVFNAAQIEGINFRQPSSERVKPFEAIQSAEEIVKGWKTGPEVIHGQSRAAYSLDNDLIYMPAKAAFRSPESYYSVLFHEMGHATGSPERLNRQMRNFFGDAAYSREELVAEMTAAFLSAKCGIDGAVIENQAAYLQSWMKALKSDPKLIVSAAGHAQKASNMIQGLDVDAPALTASINRTARGVDEVKVPTKAEEIAPAQEPSKKRAPLRVTAPSLPGMEMGD